MLKQHPDLKLRKPEPTPAVSHQGMEREVVKSHFKAIRPTLIKHNMFDKLGAKIWNMNETGIVLDNIPMKVLTRSGTKYLHSRSSGNNEVTTVIAAVNPDGGKTPPCMIPKCFMTL